MSDFINTVRTKDGTEYEVHDSRMPEIPSSGTKLYNHQIRNIRKYLADGTLDTEISSVNIITNSSTPITSVHFDTLDFIIANYPLQQLFEQGGPGYLLIGVVEFKVSGGSLVQTGYYYDNPETGSITDVVTEL